MSIKNFGKLFLAVTLFAGAAASASLPEGRYSGFISSSGFNEWCRFNQAVLNFSEPRSDGSVQVWWEETGFSNYPGAGFCENRFDATFTPTSRPNEWTVTFNFNWDLNFGRATLRDNILSIDASYTGMRTGFQSFRTRLALHPENDSITYDRRIDRWGPSLWANGILRK